MYAVQCFSPAASQGAVLYVLIRIAPAAPSSPLSSSARGSYTLSLGFVVWRTTSNDHSAQVKRT